MRLLEADKAFQSTWFAFEPDAFQNKRHVYKTLLRTQDGIQKINDITPEKLADPKLSPWYHNALSTRKIYL